jgi:hypothetical protein
MTRANTKLQSYCADEYLCRQIVKQALCPTFRAMV